MKYEICYHSIFFRMPSALNKKGNWLNIGHIKVKNHLQWDEKGKKKEKETFCYFDFPSKRMNGSILTETFHFFHLDISYWFVYGTSYTNLILIAVKYGIYCLREGNFHLNEAASVLKEIYGFEKARIDIILSFEKRRSVSPWMGL